MNEIKDLLECIAKFDNTETIEAKGRYFETIQKDAQRLVKLFAIPVVVGRSEQLTCPRCKSTNILNPDKDNDAQCIEGACIWAG